MNQLLFLLVLLACPIGMMLMMRGMHGGHRGHAEPHGDAADAPARDARITELEREIAALRDRMPDGADRSRTAVP